MKDNLINALGNELFEIENPSRYFPSEYFTKRKSLENCLKFAICFPDLYEIGMSNNAVRILYDFFNKIDGVCCDRVFSAAPDFEKLLREKNVKLFTLENHIPLNELDFIGFSIGCELGATNILQVLELGGIEIDRTKRSETDPVVIAGGPAATNPLPFSMFADFVYIGEGEACYREITDVFKKFKTRSQRIEELKKIDCLWYLGKKLAIRAIDSVFGSDNESPLLEYAVVPAFQVAQDHGTAEIMRGCPNGCRFCHAGQYYKPFRQRNAKLIEKLVDQSVNQLGYREVTLSSLSSGDYPVLDVLINNLNTKYRDKGVSFSLPSLKVSSFSLGILEQISEVRKSGLTFAIETPQLEDQHSLNKEVPVDQVIAIISEARQRGWKLAKFYFMVGMPFINRETEQENMVTFLKKIYDATKINMNINIGTFIPKAHTPFQWSYQLTIEESSEHLKSIKKALQTAIPGIKVSYHEPSISFLEGIISRGDEKVSNLIYQAYKNGCRLDAWDEYLDFDKWQKAIEQTGYDVSKREYMIGEKLPWDSVTMRVSTPYLEKEWKKAQEQTMTSICSEDCDHNCGVCSKYGKVISQAGKNADTLERQNTVRKLSEYRLAVITYSKEGMALFNSHIAVMRQFEMAFQRAGIDIKFTEGFNPKPKMEFLNPITMGVQGDNELLQVELPQEQINNTTLEKLNSCLADGYFCKSIQALPVMSDGKKISLSSRMLGSCYEISEIKDRKLEECLNSAIETGISNVKISKTDNVYTLVTSGQINIFKTVFPEDISKFKIVGSCKIVRKYITLENI